MDDWADLWPVWRWVYRVETGLAGSAGWWSAGWHDEREPFEPIVSPLFPMSPMSPL